MLILRHSESARWWALKLYSWRQYSPDSLCHVSQGGEHSSPSGDQQAGSLTAILRGGAAAEDDTSVFTLFVRVFVPTFRRKADAQEGVLDLEGGGLIRRLRRLLSGVARSVMGRKVGSKDPGGK